jgi:hypothetical protein
MEQSRTPEGGKFNQMIVDLMESDKETYDLWDMRHNHNLRGDHPANLKVLQGLLLEAIQRRQRMGGYYLDPRRNTMEAQSLKLPLSEDQSKYHLRLRLAHQTKSKQ